MKPALLVIDVQQAFSSSSPETTRSMTAAIQYINAAITLFRKQNLPVICIQHIDENDGVVPGSQGFDLVDGLNILSTDLHIHKTYGNSFNKTELLPKLMEMGVDTLILCGYCAEHCVLSTYRGARDRDLTPILLRGALASDTPENILFVESISEIISLGALGKILNP